MWISKEMWENLSKRLYSQDDRIRKLEGVVSDLGLDREATQNYGAYYTIVPNPRFEVVKKFIDKAEAEYEVKKIPASEKLVKKAV